MNPSNPVVSVNHLTCRFGKKVALDDVSIEVKRGRVFGLMGENGAGKTTLMKHILGAMTPKQGDVRVFGIDPTRNPPAVLAEIGYLSEDRALPLWMRVTEALRYTQAFYPKWDEAYAERLRNQFRLAPDTRIRHMSRGEKAKMGLLLALAHRPDLLLLDEPSSGLDAVARREILAVVVRSVAEEGRTVIFSSHLLDEVERIVDDVAMIHQGKLVLHASMDDVKATHHRRIVEFAEPRSTLPDIEGVLHAEGEGREWSIISEGDAETTKSALKAAGATIIDESTPSLDSIFVARVVGSRDPVAVA
ncbi:MAG: ABC transporter ATP-binding protein [Candidatus Hydrogenedentota bacterium]